MRRKEARIRGRKIFFMDNENLAHNHQGNAYSHKKEANKLEERHIFVKEYPCPQDGENVLGGQHCLGHAKRDIFQQPGISQTAKAKAAKAYK